MKTLIPIAAGILLLAAQSALATEIDKTVKASPTGEVHISNVSGDIKVSGWNKAEVHVKGTLGKDVEPLEVKSEKGYIEIRVRLKEGDHNGRQNTGDARLTIQVPTQTELHVSSVAADVAVSGVTGEQEIASVSGDVSVSSTSKEISAKSISGDVTVDGSAKDADITVRSISGQVKVRKVNGELDAGSVSGDVDIADCTLSRAQVKSTSGDVKYAVPVQGKGRYRFHNVSGDVSLDFGSRPDARFSISTFSGDIRNTFGPKPRASDEFTPGHKLRFTQGKGSAEVSASTLSGDVSLRD